MKIYIRNMACESCKVIVKDSLEKLNLHPVKIELGLVEVKEKVSLETKKKFNSLINKVGLEVIENKGEIFIENIKKYCLEYVNDEKNIKINISEYLSSKLGKDYNYISNIFSEIMSTTIVNYINLIKIERAKEMILFEDLNFSEMAEKLNFSSLSAFSSLFKKITGFNPTHYKNLKKIRRLTIQKLTI